MFDYIILGVLQGLFEWVPLSSEGIVALMNGLFNTGANPIDVALFLHLGTLLAVVFYFAEDWKKLFTLKTPELLRFFLISTIVSLIIGLPLYRAATRVVLGGGLLMLMAFGLLLIAYFHKKKVSFNLGFD